MEKYINKYTIVIDDFYELFQSSVICPICKDIYIKPVMCLKCQNVYCKRCVDKFNKNDENNPHKCEEPDYKESHDKNDTLSILNFYCVACEGEIRYFEAESHLEECCRGKTSDEKKFVTGFRKLSRVEVEKLFKIYKEITTLTGM